MELKIQDPSLARAPSKALGGAINKYSLSFLIFIPNIVFFFIKKSHKIVQVSGHTKLGFAPG
jgi:hypothetical protein